MTVEVDDRLAEFDYGLERNLPAADAPTGDLPQEVDAEAFMARVKAAIDDVVQSGEASDTVAIITHRGVISALLHSVMKTEQFFSVELDYAGITRLETSANGKLTVASVNGTDHVWDILYRTQWWSEEH
jgi:probable phosphoglycerate mutase